MNETYLLKDLILFWQRQLMDEFRVIEAVVNLVEYKSENLPDEEKLKIILETLHTYGLFEIGYKGDRTYYQDKSVKVPIPEEEKKPESEGEWFRPEYQVQIELYNVKLLNVTVQFESFMN